MASTLIGKTISIDGEIQSEGDVVVQGKVKGRVATQGNLFVDATGVVEAEIDTKSVEIAGQVFGNITAAEKVEITEGGRTVGDVKAQRILIADGAVFKGNVDMGMLGETPTIIEARQT
jgi:cytoskeletal protein CcmA (bactofilin family)